MFINLWGHLSYFLKDFWFYLLALFLSFTFFFIASYRTFRSSRSLESKRLLMTMFFSLLCLVMVYSGFEAYFRYRFDESDSLGFLQITSRWMARHVVYNNYFFRDRNFVREKKNGVIRIGVLGDSFAMGYGIKNVNDRFSNILENELRQEGFNVEVYNLGKSGYDTQAEIEQYQKLKELQFDWIIWEYFLNDAQPKGKSTGTKILQQGKLQGNIATFLSHQSFFFDYVYWRLSTRFDKTFVDLRTADMAAYHDEVNFARHKQDIESLIKQFKDDNTKTLVIIFPFLRFLPHYPAEDIHRTMKGIFKDNGIPTIDMLDTLRGKNSNDLVVSQFDYHPNEYVNKLAADRLNEILRVELKKSTTSATQ